MPRKPMLTVDNLIVHLQEKGVLFTIMSAKEANAYLTQNNNFFKLTSYRKNYLPYTNGPKAGKYENLEFAYLIELARIDVEVRHILLKMCLDIEHFLKVRLISFVETLTQNDSGEDGYKIVLNYISDIHQTSFGEQATNMARRASKIANNLRNNTSNPYCGDLITKYKNEMPIWAFVEIISFGDLLKMVEFCMDNYGMNLPVDIGSLDRVRQIRNATAHNNGIINDLRASNCASKTPSYITKYVSSASIGKVMRDKKLSNARINQIVHLFYVYDNLVTSTNTRHMRIEELRNLMEVRIVEHKDYFAKNDLLTSTYTFFRKLMNNFRQTN